MNRLLDRRWRRYLALILSLASAMLLAAACGGQSASSKRRPTPSTTATACVRNVHKVVTTPATTASTTAPLPAALATKLNAAARSAFGQAAAPGALVGVRTPQGTWTAAYGYADPTTKTPMTQNMYMRIGSLTKTFTATVLLRTVQDGKLSLSDPIGKYVPGIPNGNKATLEQLANMTSGIPSYTFNKQWLAAYFGHPTRAFTPGQLIAYIKNEAPMFAPGAKFFYSNTNTVLLGMAIEKATGEPFPQVLQHDVLNPLHLTGTSFPTDSSIPLPHPHGYTLQGNADGDTTPTDSTDWSPTFGWTAGQMISTLPDMLTWTGALATGQGVLSQVIATKRLDTIPIPPRVSYGIGLGCIDGWVGHTGELPGFNTTVYYDTTSATSVVVLTNSDIASGKCKDSPTLNGSDLPCSSPATRIFVGLSKALGHEFHPQPSS